jgi:hypothetical protein
MSDRRARPGSGSSFSLTDEQRALRELAHDFAEKEIRPRRPTTTCT